MKTMPCDIKKCTRVGDNGVGVRVNSLQEWKSLDEIDGKRGCVSFLVMTDTPIGMNVDIDMKEVIDAIPKELTLEDNESPSQKLYKKIVVYYEKKHKQKVKDNKEDFGKFYIKIMEHFGDIVLSKIRELEGL